MLVDLRASFRDGYFTQGRQDATGGWFFCAIYFLETEMFVASAINARWRVNCTSNRTLPVCFLHLD